MIMKLGDLVTELARESIVARASMMDVKVVVNLDGNDFEIEGVEEIHKESEYGGQVLRIHLSTD